ncbi:MAG: serine/threonine-protein phosphatase [Clostridiales bacterium]|nr:serine/threonine-protein phosphatase [Clostridiales bacterium]
MIRYFGGTDVGRKRSVNQDAFSVKTLATGEVLAVICDGMGGSNSGNIASSIALTTFTDYVETALTAYGALLGNLSGSEKKKGKSDKKTKAEEASADKKTDVENADIPMSDSGANTAVIYPSVNYPALLESAAEEANRAVYAKSRTSPEFDGMGTTLVAALVVDGTLFCANVGDSRLYLVQGGAIRQVTHDHSYVQYLVDIGRLSQAEAEVSPYKNIITRSIGREKTVSCDTYTVPLKAGAVAPEEFTDTREATPSVREMNERRAKAAAKRGREGEDSDSSKPIYILLCSDGLTNYVPREILRCEVIGQVVNIDMPPEDHEAGAEGQSGNAAVAAEGQSGNAAVAAEGQSGNAAAGAEGQSSNAAVAAGLEMPDISALPEAVPAALPDPAAFELAAAEEAAAKEEAIRTAKKEEGKATKTPHKSAAAANAAAPAEANAVLPAASKEAPVISSAKKKRDPLEPPDLEDRVATLIRSANEGGGGDNITAVIIECS